jgi:predicted metalloprotease with PDZ domain
MSRTTSRFVAQLPGLTAIGFMIVLAVSQARADEPPSAMLGIVPKDVLNHVIVQDLYVGSPAQLAGLRAGDRILEIGDKEVLSAADMIEIIREFQPGARVEIHASRQGWVKRVTVTLAERSTVVSQPLSSVAERQAPAPTVVRRPAGTINPEKLRILNDPYYRAKKSAW